MSDLQRLEAFLDGSSLIDQCHVEHYAPGDPEAITFLPALQAAAGDIFYVQNAAAVCFLGHCDFTFNAEGELAMVARCIHPPRRVEACDTYQPGLAPEGVEICSDCGCSEGLHQ